MDELDRHERAAYGVAASTWRSGPERVYRPLAAAVLDVATVPLRHADLLDIGAGTGVVGDLATAAGARCVEVDVAVAMLARHGSRRRRAVAARGAQLPLGPAAFDVGTAACSLSHAPAPVRVLAEAARVLRPGGVVRASRFPAAAQPHPARTVVEATLRRHGWVPPQWYEHLRTVGERRVETVEALADLAHAAGLTDVTVHELRVDTGVETPEALVDWRLGVAQHADFWRALADATRATIRAEALAALGPAPPRLVRGLLVLSARV
jgi:ubiquinone/menaquinone biosynthesis C-methylase UbiE